MSKVVPLLIGGTGLAAASYGGYVLFKGKGAAGEGKQVEGAQTNPLPQNGAGTGVNTAPTQKNSQAEVNLIFDDVDAFKKNAKDSECIKTDFGNDFDIQNTDAKEIDNTNKPEGDSSFFKTGSDEEKSCLIVNWKKESKDNKGTGKFTWLWTFIKGDEGFINFNVAEPSGEEGKLKFTGAFYLVEKESSSQKGSAKFKKEVTGNDKKADSTSLNDFFPKAGSGLKTEAGGDYGGLVDAADKLKDLCKNASDCKDAQLTTKKFHWKSTTDETKTLKDGTTSLGWGDKIFGVKGQWNLEEKIKEIKGTGSLATQ